MNKWSFLVLFLLGAVALNYSYVDAHEAVHMQNCIYNGGEVLEMKNRIFTGYTHCNQTSSEQNLGDVVNEAVGYNFFGMMALQYVTFMMMIYFIFVHKKEEYYE